ncbi:MAG: DUF2267 domain-containing protein [Gammaproteobacteria bacterium]|nr:DUF2267 domain-containing protein [Gammaproteobacteria bacterium]NIM72650.1 DUF2267 domain-containing protein [Gammaproteobacteria bacterium]NIN37708.1 DUF2267 domain-containing protein [Gammaproteobacteria bacterium]NIO24411.1 DUF2267 domain-containing protein [Gammaproteobacteria bacterium]NIO65014.1 DUF2267 domain-containing protein [Gammaproteobacteria bacterium]
MSNTGLRAFDETLQVTNTWLKGVMEQAGSEDREDAYAALRAVLQALRDRLSVDDATHLGAQLPMLVRGFYYEGWHPAGRPYRERSKEQFLEHVQERLRGREHLDAEQVARAVFRLLAERVSAGEVEKVKHALPEPVRDLWPGESS